MKVDTHLVLLNELGVGLGLKEIIENETVTPGHFRNINLLRNRLVLVAGISLEVKEANIVPFDILESFLAEEGLRKLQQREEIFRLDSDPNLITLVILNDAVDQSKLIPQVVVALTLKMGEDPILWVGTSHQNLHQVKGILEYLLMLRVSLAEDIDQSDQLVGVCCS